MAILDIIFPKRCVRCGRVGSYICTLCAEDADPVLGNEMICPMCEKPAIDGIVHPRCHTKYSLDGLFSFFHYRDSIRYIVKALKYRAISDIAGTCEAIVPSWSYEACSRTIGSKLAHSICVPVPLYGARKKQRGFNQSEILGRFIVQKLRIPIAPDILYRTKYTTPQVEMKDRKDRLENMKDVFAVHKGTQIVPQAVILFDDVWTTGATMRAAANVLKRSGTTYVWAVTFAR